MKTKKVKMYCPVCFRVRDVPECFIDHSLCLPCRVKTGLRQKLLFTPFEMIREKNVYK